MMSLRNEWLPIKQQLKDLSKSVRSDSQSNSDVAAFPKLIDSLDEKVTELFNHTGIKTSDELGEEILIDIVNIQQILSQVVFRPFNAIVYELYTALVLFGVKLVCKEVASKKKAKDYAIGYLSCEFIRVYINYCLYRKKPPLYADLQQFIEKITALPLLANFLLDFEANEASSANVHFFWNQCVNSRDPVLLQTICAAFSQMKIGKPLAYRSGMSTIIRKYFREQQKKIDNIQPILALLYEYSTDLNDILVLVVDICYQERLKVDRESESVISSEHKNFSKLEKNEYNNITLPLYQSLIKSLLEQGANPNCVDELFAYKGKAVFEKWIVCCDGLELAVQQANESLEIFTKHKNFQFAIEGETHPGLKILQACRTAIMAQELVLRHNAPLTWHSFLTTKAFSLSLLPTMRQLAAKSKPLRKKELYQHVEFLFQSRFSPLNSTYFFDKQINFVRNIAMQVLAALLEASEYLDDEAQQRIVKLVGDDEYVQKLVTVFATWRPQNDKKPNTSLYNQQLYAMAQYFIAQQKKNNTVELPIEIFIAIMCQVALLSNIKIEPKEVEACFASLVNSVQFVARLKDQVAYQTHLAQLSASLNNYIEHGGNSEQSLEYFKFNFKREQAEKSYNQLIKEIQQKLIAELQEMLSLSYQVLVQVDAFKELENKFMRADLTQHFHKLVATALEGKNILDYIAQKPAITTFFAKDALESRLKKLLFAAVKTGDIELINRLLTHQDKIDLNAQDKEGKTLLFYAMHNEQVFAILLAQKVSLANVYKKKSAYYCAAYSGNLAALNKLPKHPHPEALDRFLRFAVAGGQVALVNTLVKSGANGLYTHKEKSTLLLAAEKSKRAEDPILWCLMQQCGHSIFNSLVQAAVRRYLEAGKGGAEGQLRACQLIEKIQNQSSLLEVLQVLMLHFNRLEGGTSLFRPQHGGNLHDHSFDTYLLKAIFQHPCLKIWLLRGDDNTVPAVNLDNIEGRKAFKIILLTQLQAKISMLEPKVESTLQPLVK